MSKKKSDAPKLKLNRETVAALDEEQLDEAAGGAVTDYCAPDPGSQEITCPQVCMPATQIPVC